jgi:hypothetical protein
MVQIKTFFKKSFFSDYRVLFGLWMILAVISFLAKMRFDRHNNYLIFKYVYWHAIKGTSLYDQYPKEFFDSNHYGPIFSLVIAPFAVMPDWLGILFWLILLSVGLFVSVRKLPVDKRIHVFIYWFCAHELLTALFMQQFNIATVAMIVATYTCIEKEKEGWAAFWIMLGTFVKLYGIVGLAFFFFSKHKGKFIIYLLIWTAVLFVAPMIISNYDYIVSQYVGWYHSLAEKNAVNGDLHGGTNISLFGMVHRISGCVSFSDLYLLLPGMVLFAIPYLRFKQYKNLYFRLAYLASTLLFVILFSTGSESSTYIIAFVGIVLWYAAVPWRRGGWDIALMVFVFVLSSLSPSDLFPRYLRVTYVQPYSLKALPCVIVWLRLIYEMCFKNYAQVDSIYAEDDSKNKE